MVSSEATTAAQRRANASLPVTGTEVALRPAEQVHQPALAKRQTEQIGDCHQQPLVGKRLLGVERSGNRM